MSWCEMENPKCSRRSWRFTWESLVHIPMLRLYIFNPDLDVGDTSTQCRFLEASLRLELSLLLVSWQHDDDDEATEVSKGRVFLRIPVPRALIDPGCPVHVKAMGDHIEAKLALLLPVDHPPEPQLLEASGIDPHSHLPLSPDIEKFSSEGVNIFCKSCSTKLTRQPLRNFVEIPSINWQEVADNWFGGCCSFGGASEKLVSKYWETFNCEEGTCLLDKASVAVCEHDLEDGVLERTTSDLGMKSSESNDTNSMICDSVSSQAWSNSEAHEVHYINQLGLVGTENDINMDLLKPNLNNFSLCNEKTFLESIGGRTSNCDFHCCITEKVQTSDHNDGRIESEASTAASNAQLSLKVYGNGFMVTPANLSNDVECVEFSCRHCSSPLGSCAFVQGTTAPVVGGIRLFKCYISTSLTAGAPDDAFKNYTLESIFTNMLIEGARDELSFCVIVCDLRTKFPILRVVLLNSRVWCCSGFCYENTSTRGLPAIHMQPVVKLLFSDCSASTEANSMISKKRSGWNGTEEVYMMNREIEEIRRSLKSSVAKLPPSCSSFQGMSLSFLER